MRLIASAFFSCMVLLAGQSNAQGQPINGDEFATSRKYCDAQWQSLTAANSTGGQSHEKFSKRCVCDRRWQEKVAANIGDQKSRERDRLRCLGYLGGSDAAEYAFFGGSTLILSLIGLTSGGDPEVGTRGHAVSP
jgi:hypothetical protein